MEPDGRMVHRGGVLRWVVPTQRARDGRPADDRIDDLAARLGAACAGAVDADEVAAVLEAIGITDQVARRGYGQPEVFALAGQVLRRVGGQAPAPPVRWDWRGLLRPPLLAVRLVVAAAIGGAGWWLGPTTVLPALVAVPLAELLVAWHRGHARWGLAVYDTVAAWRRHLRAIGWATLTALVAPLLVAVALAGAGRGMPPDLPQAPGGLLRAAVGVLIAGGYPLLLLLAANRRTGAAVLLTCLAVGGTGPVAGAWPGVAHGPRLAVSVLAAAYLTGLVLTAAVLFDPRGYR